MPGLKSYIARKIGFPAQDLFTGTSILHTLNFLKESQYWEEERIQNYQLSKLKSLVTFAGNYVPYYEELFRKIKLSPDDIRKLEDIQKVPILTKEIFRRENKQLIARNYKRFRIKVGKTGGTTGSPVFKYIDQHNRSFTWASYYRWYEWMGLKYFDKSATFWGARTVLASSPKQKLYEKFVNFSQNSLTFNSFALNEAGMDRMYKGIARFNPLLLKGYLSSLLDVAGYLEKNELEINNLLAVAPTSETLLPTHRKYLEKVFSVPVFDQYGCGEVSAISYECAEHNGLHINREHVLCEILDENNNPIINSPGRVIATDLDNMAMPVIRYENGDYATVSEKICTCGVNQPLMASIDGRTTDVIILKNGSKVHGVFFTDIFYELGITAEQVIRFQVYQKIPGEIEFKMESKKSLSPEIENSLQGALSKFFSRVEISNHEELQTEPSGKFRYIISEVQQK